MILHITDLLEIFRVVKVTFPAGQPRMHAAPHLDLMVTLTAGGVLGTP